MEKPKALYIKANGTEQEVEPENGHDFSLEELQKFVGGMIEIIQFPDGKILVCNEEGKLDGLQANKKATEIWKEQFPIKEYSNNNDELVVGDVLICDSSLVL